MSYTTEIVKCYKCGHRFGTPIDLHQHQQSCKAVLVTPVDRWGNRPCFQAKVGTLGSCLVLIKGAKRAGQPFSENEPVQYAEWSTLQGMSTGCTPKWGHGYIWKIEDNRIFINR